MSHTKNKSEPQLFSGRDLFHTTDEPILKFWQKNDIFKKSINSRPEENAYVFYDGPPFVTGIPHFGHLFVSTLKDVIPRYQTMLGKRVERVWGWDCHGLPIEEKVERKLGTKNRRDIEKKIGLERFIKECKTYVNEISDQWDWYINHIGRWVDIQNPYRTDSLQYMESVIWGIKQAYEKGLIYHGKRISLYCPRCGTPLSKFEIQMDNSYKELEDPSVIVKFKVKYRGTGVGVGVVIENEQGQILMAVRNEPNRKAVWGLVGGKMDPEDKDLYDTVKREVYEETGTEVEDIVYYGSSIDVFEGRLFETHHFKAKIKGQPVKNSDELNEFEWVDKDKIPRENMHIPTRNCLRDVLSGSPIPEKPQVKKPDVYLLVWTTTPWTLPQNVAIAVDKGKTYVTVEHNGEYYILAKARLGEVFKDKEYEVIDEYKGDELVGLEYEPLFGYFKGEATDKDFKVYAADFVSMEEGTGLVHMAPAYGEDDFRLAQDIGLSIFEAIDEQGRFTEPVSDYKGMYFKDADKHIIQKLKGERKMFKNDTIIHSYPVCYRCKTPLLYKAQESWFIRLEGEIKEHMLKNAKKIRWVPEHSARAFENVIKTAPDWGISRTRYWATPLPFWKCDKCGHMEVLGSIREIEERSGKKVVDLHRPYIDEHTYKCPKCSQGTMRRIPDVVDVWFESGSMPYAQFHYPFKNKNRFRQNFPADFIVEYVAQIKGWFNVLHRVSTILFDSNAFKNVIAHGVILGTDGRKMSKSLGNYPDPRSTIEKYGADALRLYFTSYSFVESGSEPFKEEFVREQIKEVILPLLNIYNFFVLNYRNDISLDIRRDTFLPEHILDRWILYRINSFVKSVRDSLDAYRIPAAANQLPDIVKDVSAWYIKRSRERFKIGNKQAVQTLWLVLVDLVKAAAPFIPFVTEAVYQELRKLNRNLLESVHLDYYPEIVEYDPRDVEYVTQNMEITRSLASALHSIRVSEGIPVKQPLYTAYIDNEHSIPEEFLRLLAEEVNVKSVRLADVSDLKGDMIKVAADDDIKVALDITVDNTLLKERILREVIRHIQMARKKAGLKIGQKVGISLQVDKQLYGMIKDADEYIREQVDASSLKFDVLEADQKGENIIKVIGKYKLSIILHQ